MRDFFGPSSVCGRKFYVDSESRSFFGSVSSSHLFDVFFYFSNQLIFKFRCRRNVFLAAPIVCLRHSSASYILILMRARKWEENINRHRRYIHERAYIQIRNPFNHPSNNNYKLSCFWIWWMWSRLSSLLFSFGAHGSKPKQQRQRNEIIKN